jgi:signal transduction histidine kinase/putative methionine-R-sulfoxide reductase with GAF domain
MSQKEDIIPTTATKRSESDLAGIYQAGLTVGRLVDLPGVLHTTVDSAARLLGADVVTLYQYDSAKSEFIGSPVAVGVSEAFYRERARPSSDGSAARIAKSGKPIIADRAAEHPEISRGFVEAERITSSAGFPLKVDDTTVGVLFLNYHEYHKLTAEDIRKVSMFADLATIALRLESVNSQLESVNKRLQLLDQAREAIESATRLDEVLKRILDAGLTLVSAKRGSLMLIEHEDLVTKAQFGPELGTSGHVKMAFKVSEGIVGQVAQTGEAIVCPDVTKDPRFKQPPTGKLLRFSSLLAVPIRSSDGRVIGVINADDPKPGYFDETHKQILLDMAGQFSSAIERMMLLETLRALHQIFERITSVAISSRELTPVLEEIAESAINILKFDVITIYQYDQDRDRFMTPPLMRGIRSEQPMRMEVFEGEAPWVLVHPPKEHRYAPDAKSDQMMNPPRPPNKGAGFVSREHIESSAGLLLKVGEEVLGIMFVNYRTPHAFLEREKQIIETFASSAAIAIKAARQWESLRSAQDQLVQTERMSAIGTLAASVAHELRNPIGNISNRVDVLKLGYFDPDEASQIFDEIETNITHAGEIIENLLGFARPARGLPGPVDVVGAANEAINVLRNHARLNHVTIDPHLEAVPSVEGNMTLLRQVFFNIMRNALDAMQEGGTLTVRVTDQDRVVRVVIEDTGPGIAPEVRSKIFFPFVTTKAASQGTGLGLALSYKIVTDHHGDIKVEDRPGGGTRFVISLPKKE